MNNIVTKQAGKKQNSAITPIQLFSKLTFAEFSSVFDLIQDAILVLKIENSDNCKSIYVNSATAKLLEYTKSEILNISPYSIIGPLDQSKFKYAVENYPQEQIAFKDLSLKKSNGSLIYVEINIEFLTIANESFFFLLIRDLSSQILNLREKKDFSKNYFLQAKLASIGKFADGIAHEIKNPLTIIKGNMALLPGEDPISMRLIPRINKGIERINNIIKALQIYSLNQNDTEVVININETVEKMMDIVLTIFGSNNLSFKRNISPKTLRAKGIPWSFEQSIMHLLQNAKDAVINLEKGIVSLTLSEENEMIKIEISDNGVGIKPGILEHIFDPFFTTKDVGAGSGLGLHICYAVITEMQGFIEVQTEPGKGTTFLLYLKPYVKI